MALGVIACNAIKAIIARLVGSAIAWKMSRLIYLNLILETIWLQIYAQHFGFSNLFPIFFQKVRIKVGIVSLVSRPTMPANICVYSLFLSAQNWVYKNNCLYIS